VETKDRIVLLDDLMVLNEQACLPEDEVAGLVDFLAALPEGEREGILDYIRQGDHYARFERFSGLANMEPGKRAKILKAMGVQVAAQNGFLKELLGVTAESVSQAKQHVHELAAARKTLQEDLLEPLASLFGPRKRDRK
jgi:hypothetical protein